MARDPGSLWSPLAENGRQGSFTKTQFIVHSTGDRGTAAAIFNYFNRAEVVVESTFVVGRGPEDPTRQLLDSASGADANLGANQRAICVEVVGTEGDPFTDWQVSEIVRLGRWARANHPIEPRICPTHDTSGFGWHVLFGSPGPWTPVAKSCPGRTRIQQLQTIVFPAIFNNQEDDMYGSNERNEVVGRLDEAIGLLRAIHPAVASMRVGLMDPTSGVRTIVLKLAGREPVSVPAGELAAAIAPLLADHVAALSDADIDRIKVAVADEQAHRQAA